MQSHVAPESGSPDKNSLDSNAFDSNSPVVYDPVSPEAHLDPYPIYQQLRDHHPLYYIAKHDAWALSRYTDVQEGLRDWETFSSSETFSSGGSSSMESLTRAPPLPPKKKHGQCLC